MGRVKRTCSCCYFRPAECTHYKNPEKECWFLANGKNNENETNGDAIRALIATDDALADQLIKRARTDGGQHLYGLWCDDRGSCVSDPKAGCCDEWQKACVLRWIKAKATEKTEVF